MSSTTDLALPPAIKYTPSAFQVAVFQKVQERDANIIVSAVAGSGKSTTVEGSFWFCGRAERVRCLAFNKAIATEMESRVSKAGLSGVQAGTFHSACFRDWQAFSRSTVDGSKIRKLVNEVVPFNEREERSTVIALVAKAKVHGLVPKTAAQLAPVKGLMEDTDDAWLGFAKRYDIELPYQYGRVLEYARQVLTRSITNRAVIDFDDMLYMTCIYNVRMQKFDRIFVDETQDLSDIQMELLERMGDKHTRYVFVGDRRQSLYAFRGADSQAMDRMKERFGCVELPLSISYRCAKNIVAYAQRYEPLIQAAPNAPDGIVAEKGDMFAQKFEVGDLVVCRTNAPVIKLAFHLIALGIRVCVQGRDLAEKLKGVVRKLKALDVENLMKRIGEWEATQVSLMTAADEDEAKIEAVIDTATTLKCIIESSEAKTIPAVEAAIEALFEGEGDVVLLSTVHRAKGLEANRVYVIDHHITPRWAMKNPEQMEQAENVRYVAVTRAKTELFFIDAPKTAPKKTARA